MIKYDIDELLLVFDELLPITDKEQQAFWFKYSRQDEVEITLFISKFDGLSSLIIKNESITFSSMHLNNCFEVRVLDPSNKQLEITYGSQEKLEYRLFLSLLKSNIAELEPFE